MDIGRFLNQLQDPIAPRMAGISDGIVAIVIGAGRLRKGAGVVEH
jgi:hypothetical protein